jgi:hypothetical protein
MSVLHPWLGSRPGQLQSSSWGLAQCLDTTARSTRRVLTGSTRKGSRIVVIILLPFLLLTILVKCLIANELRPFVGILFYLLLIYCLTRIDFDFPCIIRSLQFKNLTPPAASGNQTHIEFLHTIDIPPFSPYTNFRDQVEISPFDCEYISCNCGDRGNKCHLLFKQAKKEYL